MLNASAMIKSNWIGSGRTDPIRNRIHVDWPINPTTTSITPLFIEATYRNYLALYT